MPRKKHVKPFDGSQLERTTVRLWSDDLNYIRDKFPDNYNAQIRRIVGMWVRQEKQDENDITD